MIINLGSASIDNHIPRDDILDYHPRRECNINIILAIVCMSFSEFSSDSNTKNDEHCLCHRMYFTEKFVVLFLIQNICCWYSVNRLNKTFFLSTQQICLN